MQRKYLLIVLAFALISGMAVVALPSVKASERSDVYIYVDPHIIPSPGALPAFLIVEVWIDSPDAWDNQVDGIVGWALSVRVDPRFMVVWGAQRGQPETATLPTGGTPMGFLENFLVRYGYLYYHPFTKWTGTKTSWNVAVVDTDTGTMLDISEQIIGYGSLGVGAGGGPTKLMELMLEATTLTDPSVIDLFGPPRPPVIVAQPMYLTVDASGGGHWHEAEVVEDGAYIAETPATMYFDTGGYTGGDPMYTDWHELWPTLCQWWSMESWEDQGDGVLSESDQVDLVQTDGSAIGTVIWGHVVWVNPDPVAGDGMADLIIEVKVPEFPLGMTPILVLMLGIPVVYLWRRKEWSN